MARKRETINSDSGGPRIDKRARKRISIYLDDTGAPDLSGLTEEQQHQLGLKPSEPPPPVEIPPAIPAMMLTVLVSIEAAVIAPRMGIPTDQARAALEPPPPVFAALEECSMRVLQKYSGSIGPYADEFALVALLISWQASAFAELRRIQADTRPGPDSITRPAEAPPPIDRHESTTAPAPFVVPPRPAPPAEPEPIVPLFEPAPDFASFDGGAD